MKYLNAWVVGRLLRKVRSWLAKQNLVEMFSREEILRSAVLAVIGGIVIVLVLKLMEAEGTAMQREIRGEDDLNEAEKQPQEHDERLC